MHFTLVYSKGMTKEDPREDSGSVVEYYSGQ